MIGVYAFGPKITAILNCLADGLIPPKAMEHMVFDMVCA